MPYDPATGWRALTASELAAILASLPPDAPVLVLADGHRLIGTTHVSTWDQGAPRPRIVIACLPDDLCPRCLEHAVECRCRG